MSQAVAAVDWGTTRLRIWLLGEDGTVEGERRSDDGMLAARPDRFGTVLERTLGELDAPADLPVIVCGMAGARQGWIEAPYVNVPASLGEIFHAAITVPHEGRVVRIVPGLAQASVDAPDVMRGEETQLAGAVAGFEPGPNLVCMPGTHSKWVEVTDNVVTGFQTVMTGELYSVIATNTILSHSLGGKPTPVSPGDTVFLDACSHAAKGEASLETHLFRLRAGTLLNGLSPEDASARLSGLLIGAEIAAGRRRFASGDLPIMLIASGLMKDLYGAAFDAAGLAHRIVDADEAVRFGLFGAARHLGMVEAEALA